MQHIEEHILELYVLNAAEVEGRQAEIEAHVAECAGCRALLAQITESYRSVAEKFKELEAGQKNSETLVPYRFRSIAPMKEGLLKTSPFQPVTILQRFQYFVRRHPVMVGGGTFVAFAGLALLANLTFGPSLFKDDNPVRYRYNPPTNAVEILNEKNEILWQILSRDVSGVQYSEHTTGTHFTLIDDIDGDGSNEVLTVLWQPGDIESWTASPLRVYRKGNTLWYQTGFQEQVKYLGRSYADLWASSKLITTRSETRGQKDILVIWDNARSPDVVVRYDARGKELGQYWHFGNIQGMFAVDIDGDGKEELILTGINDTGDTLHQSYPSIAVLDPQRIVGKKKSICSPGFAQQESNAELYYLQLPISPLSRALLRFEIVTSLIQEPNSTLTFFVVNSQGIDDPDQTMYEYSFSPDFRLREVKSTTKTDQIYERKAKEGLVKGTIDTAYLKALKEGVRYWDGEKWVKEAVKIRHGDVALR